MWHTDIPQATFLGLDLVFISAKHPAGWFSAWQYAPRLSCPRISSTAAAPYPFQA
jgi:hypothetical protein